MKGLCLAESLNDPPRLPWVWDPRRVRLVTDANGGSDAGLVKILGETRSGKDRLQDRLQSKEKKLAGGGGQLCKEETHLETDGADSRNKVPGQRFQELIMEALRRQIANVLLKSLTY